MKKMIFTLAIVAMSAVGLCASASHVATASEGSVNASATTHMHVASEGKHCNGSVGCDCRGFRPITNGKEWQKSYCKDCGHHRSNHR